MILPIFVLTLSITIVSVIQNLNSERVIEEQEKREATFFHNFALEKSISQMRDVVTPEIAQNPFKDLLFATNTCNSNLKLINQCRQSYTLLDAGSISADERFFCDAYYGYFTNKNKALGRDEFSPTEDDIKELLMINTSFVPISVDEENKDILTDLYADLTVNPVSIAFSTMSTANFEATFKAQSFERIRNTLPRTFTPTESYLSNSISVRFNDEVTDERNLFFGVDVKFHSTANNGVDKKRDALVAYYQVTVPRLLKVRQYLNAGLTSDGMARVFHEAQTVLADEGNIKRGDVRTRNVYEAEFLQTYLRYVSELRVLSLSDKDFGANLVGDKDITELDLETASLLAFVDTISADIFEDSMRIMGYRVLAVSPPQSDRNLPKQGVQNISMCDMEKLLSYQQINK